MLIGFFVFQICGSFSSHAGIQGHIKMHHAHTNVIGLGDSSVWKVPFLPRFIYLFLAPLAVPVITPLVALGRFLHSKYFIGECDSPRRSRNLPARLELPCELPSLTQVPVSSHTRVEMLVF